MSEFQSGKREGYIYGYIFLSGNNGLVLDDGPHEYPIESAELLINGKFNARFIEDKRAIRF